MSDEDQCVDGIETLTTLLLSLVGYLVGHGLSEDVIVEKSNKLRQYMEDKEWTDLARMGAVSAVLAQLINNNNSKKKGD